MGKISNPDALLDRDDAGRAGADDSVAGRRLTPALHVSFGFFLFSSAFSIAAAQIALGFSLLLFVTLVIARGRSALPTVERSIWLTIAGYIAWLVVSALAGASPLDSLRALREEWLFLAVPVAAFLFRDRKASKQLILALATGLTLVAIYGIIQHFTGVHWFRSAPLSSAGPFFRPAGNFSHPLTYGNYVVVATVFLLGYGLVRWKDHSGWRRAVLAAPGIAGILVIPLLGSRGPMLAAVGGVLVLGFLMRKLRYVVPVLAGVILVVWAFSPGWTTSLAARLERDLTADHSLSRLYIWNQSLKIIADHPLTGVGPGNFADEYQSRLPEGAERRYPIGHAHSDYLNVATVAGLPGLFLYLAIWLAIVRRIHRAYSNSRESSQRRALCLGALVASAAFLVASLTEAAFADEEVRQLIMAIWGIGLSVSSGGEDADTAAGP